MQLYLGGPKNKFFNIFSSDNNIYDNFTDEGFYNIENFTPNELLKTQYQSVVSVFTEKEIHIEKLKFQITKSHKYNRIIFVFYIRDNFIR